MLLKLSRIALPTLTRSRTLAREQQLRSSTELLNPLARVQIRAQIMTGNPGSGLDRQHVLCRNPLVAVYPIGNGPLRTKSKKLGEAGLPSGRIDSPPQSEDSSAGHESPFTTVGDIKASTQSGNDFQQTGEVPKAAKTSDLWRRFAESVMDLTKSKSLRQEDIRREIGVGQTAVSGYKTGEKTPSLPVGLSMAEYAEMCVQYLYTGKGPQRPWSDVDPQFRKLVEYWEALDDANRGKIIDHAEALYALQGKRRRPRWQPPEDSAKPPRRTPH